MANINNVMSNTELHVNGTLTCRSHQVCSSIKVTALGHVIVNLIEDEDGNKIKQQINFILLTKLVYKLLLIAK